MTRTNQFSDGTERRAKKCRTTFQNETATILDLAAFSEIEINGVRDEIRGKSVFGTRDFMNLVINLRRLSFYRTPFIDHEMSKASIEKIIAKGIGDKIMRALTPFTLYFGDLNEFAAAFLLESGLILVVSANDRLANFVIVSDLPPAFTQGMDCEYLQNKLRSHFNLFHPFELTLADCIRI